MSEPEHEKPNDHEDVIPPRVSTNTLEVHAHDSVESGTPYKHLDQVLPSLNQQTAKELANPTGVTFLVANLRRAEATAESLRTENARMDKENKTLSVNVARLSERQKFKWMESTTTSLAGASFSAVGWPDVKGIAILFCIGIGIVLLLATIGIHISSSSSSKGNS